MKFKKILIRIVLPIIFILGVTYLVLALIFNDPFNDSTRYISTCGTDDFINGNCTVDGGYPLVTEEDFIWDLIKKEKGEINKEELLEIARREMKYVDSDSDSFFYQDQKARIQSFIDILEKKY